MADMPGMEDSNRVAVGELRSFVERIERLESEMKELQTHRKEVLAEAKSCGYDTKIIKKIVQMRKRDPQDLAEEEAVFEIYRDALGI